MRLDRICSGLIPVVALISLAIGCPRRAAAERESRADDRVGVLTLTTGGNSIAGRLCPSESPGIICWQGIDFVEPLEFRLGAIESIKWPSQAPQQRSPGEFSLEFSSGDVVTGRLVSWSRQAIEIRSEQFGKMVVRPEAIVRLHRIEENAMLVFASLLGLRNWRSSTWDASGWEEDGNQLWTATAGATLNADLRVPRRAAVEFELSWIDQPDFVFAIGVDPASNRGSDGWRLETVGSLLAIVRERGSVADVDVVADLTQRQSIRLTAYVDQRSGEMRVFLADGTPAGRVGSATTVDGRGDGAEDAVPVGHGLRVVNRGKLLRLERLRIARWLGNIPARVDAEQASIALADGEFVSGVIKRFDPDTGTLVLAGQPAAVTSVPLDRVMAIKFAATDQQPDPARCALFLQGGIRLSGQTIAVEDRHWVITGPNFQQPMRVAHDQVRSMVVFDHQDAQSPEDEPPGRPGRLELGQHQLAGRLVPCQEDETIAASCLRWHPRGSRNSSPLRQSASGKIVYRDSPKIDENSAAARAEALQRLRLQRQKRGLNFGELFLKRTDQSKSKSARRDAHVVHTRSGDVVACRVESIDARGVHVTTDNAGESLIDHRKVKAIEMIGNASPPDLDEAKRKRLLTIPRLQKSSPPSHLLCSHNGDYLRCRLLRVDEETVYVEVQMEEVRIPRVRIAQIIWFHPDESETAVAGDVGLDHAGDDSAADESAGSATQPQQPSAAGDGYANLAQVLKRDGRRVTVDPTEVTENQFHGVSDLVGPWSVALAEIDQLIFGRRIATEVRDLAYNRWKLQPAVEPLVMQAAAEAAEMGSDSPLVGREAPDARVQLLDGAEVRLSQWKGKILVLDFWASWCAPCMQTMPLVQEAVSGLNSDKVDLLSVNLEESADHVRGVLERHRLAVPVALDVDGVAAQRYQATAIPQLVIIGADGKIQKVYTGGGAEVVEQMKAAITELLAAPPL